MASYLVSILDFWSVTPVIWKINKCIMSNWIFKDGRASLIAMFFFYWKVPLLPIPGRTCTKNQTFWASPRWNLLAPDKVSVTFFHQRLGVALQKTLGTYCHLEKHMYESFINLKFQKRFWWEYVQTQTTYQTPNKWKSDRQDPAMAQKHSHLSGTGATTTKLGIPSWVNVRSRAVFSLHFCFSPTIL